MIDNKQREFMQAYEACHRSFVNYCSALAYGKMDTADLVQDVLLSAYKNFDGIKDKDKFLHYLIRAARNRAISLRRKNKYRFDILENYENRLASKEIAPDIIMDVQFLYRSLDRLPEKQRDALVLFEISGFSIKEIANIQNKSISAVKTMMSRGRAKLRDIISNEDVEIKQLFSSLQTILL